MPSATDQTAHQQAVDEEAGPHVSTEDQIVGDMVPCLPIEVLCQVVNYVEFLSSAQRDLWALTLVSRSWYAAAVASLYKKPDISGRNFGLFVRTLCPSINAHIRKTGFSSMVKELNMSKLVHDSSKSLTSRILGRLKDGLEIFVAPQASFAINCLAALSKCQYLRELDLSYVSESLGLLQLLRSISKLSRLENLSIRCKLDYPADRAPSNVFWPPKLKALQLSACINDNDFVIFSTIPKSLISLTLHHCPGLNGESIKTILMNFGDVLESFQFEPRTSDSLTYIDLAHWIEYAPRLRRLFIPASSYSIRTGYDFPMSLRYSVQNPHPLEHLEFDCTYLDRYGSELDYEDIWLAIAEGYLSRVRRLGFRHQVTVQPWRTNRRELQDLDDLLRALAREDGENANIKEEEAGVYVCS
ncbi:MAG: hypothetical protein L6R38_001044 [Xanthoria sp. 2 TBL-2021]|nr:MAG: hypothetical protein L6R38_001044 [Xanthoria sp. 2 TBL-2021]